MNHFYSIVLIVRIILGNLYLTTQMIQPCSYMVIELFKNIYQVSVFVFLKNLTIHEFDFTHMCTLY